MGIRVMPFKKAITEIQKPDKKGEKHSKESIDFIINLFKRTFQDVVSNSALPLRIAVEFYDKNPISDRTKKAMKTQKEVLCRFSKFIEFIQNLNSNNAIVIEHTSDVDDSRYYTFQFKDKP